MSGEILFNFHFHNQITPLTNTLKIVIAREDNWPAPKKLLFMGNLVGISKEH